MTQRLCVDCKYHIEFKLAEDDTVHFCENPFFKEAASPVDGVRHMKYEGLCKQLREDYFMCSQEGIHWVPKPEFQTTEDVKEIDREKT